MTSNLEDILKKNRNLTPKNIIDLFPDDECTIENEAQFIENVKKRLPHLTFFEDLVQEHKSWRFMVVRIYEHLDRKLQNLQAAKAENSPEAKTLINAIEKSIETMIDVIREITKKTTQKIPAPFPFFGRILEVTRNPNIIRSLILLSGTTLSNENCYLEDILPIFPLFSFLTPFLRMMYHCNWDLQNVAKLFSNSDSEEGSKEGLQSIDKQVLARSLHNSDVIAAVLAQESLPDSENKTLFLDTLFSKICKQGNISKETDESAYYKVLGELYMVSSLLYPESNTKILPDFVIIYGFQGFFLSFVKQNDEPSKLTSLTLEHCHQHYKCPLQSSIVDIVAAKARDIAQRKQSSPEAYQQDIEILSLYFMGLRYQIELFKQMKVAYKLGTDCDELLQKFYCIDLQSSQTDKEAVLIQIWKTCLSVYKEHYSTYTDEIYDNMFSQMTDLLKDKVNLMMSNIILLITSTFEELFEFSNAGEEENYEKKFKDSYIFVANFLVDDMVKMFERFDLEKDYTSFIVLYSIFSGLQQLKNCHQVVTDVQVPVRIIKKFESIVQWSYTRDFLVLFEKAPNTEFVKDIIWIALDLVAGILVYDENDELTKAEKEYMTHMSTFNTVDFITNNPKVQGHPHAAEAQEKIIRYYVSVHLVSQKLTMKGEDTDYFVYYTFERLQQIWKIIMENIAHEKLTAEEYGDTVDIIMSLLDRDEDDPKYWKVFNKDILVAVYGDALLDPEAESVYFEGDNLQDIIPSVQSHNREEYKEFLDQISRRLIRTFRHLQQEIEALDTLFKQNDPKFLKSLLRIETKIQQLPARLEICLNGLDTDTEGEVLSLDYRETLQVCLAKFFMSPVAYIAENRAGTLATYINDYENKNSFYSCLLPEYIAKFSETLEFLNEELKKDNPNPFVIKALETLGLGTYVRKFQLGTFTDDPREVYKVCSKFGILQVMDRITMDQPPFEEAISTVISPFEAKMTEITTAWVNTLYLMAKKNLKKGEKVYVERVLSFADQNILFDFSDTTETVKGYFTNKTKFLADIMTTNDETKTPEENLMFQLGGLMAFQQFISVAEPIQLAKLFDIVPESMEKIFGFCFEAFIRLSQIVNKHNLETNSDLPVNIKNELLYLLSFTRTAIKNYFQKAGDILWYGKKKNYRKRHTEAPQVNILKSAVRGLVQHIDSLDHKLWPLYLLRKDNSPNSISDLSDAMPVIFAFYQDALNALADFYLKEGQTEDEPKGWGKPYYPKGKGLKRPIFSRGRRNRNKKKEDAGLAEEEVTEDIQEIPADKPDPSELEEYKNVLVKLLAKFIDDTASVSTSVVLRPAYFEVFKGLMDKYIAFISSFSGDSDGLEALISLNKEGVDTTQIYKNSLVNGIRILAPVLQYFTKFRFSQKSGLETLGQTESAWMLETMNKMVRGVASLMNNLTAEEILQEDHQLLIMDFIRHLRNIAFALVDFAMDFLARYSDFNTEPSEFNQTFQVLYALLKKFGKLSKALDGISLYMKPVLGNLGTLLVICSGLVYTGSIDELVQDKEVLETLQMNCGDAFYNIAELYGLKAYEPIKILPLKLKALVQLDNSGSRIFQNGTIKMLEKCWDGELKEAWDLFFAIEETGETTNKHSTRRVVITDNEDVQGKIKIPLEEKVVSVSTLTFLKEGMNKSTKDFLEAMMKHVVSMTRKHMQQLSQATEETKEDYSSLIYAQVVSLSAMIKNFPELSVLITSYNLTEADQSDQNAIGVLPSSAGTESFISFFVKHVCYLYSFSASSLLDQLVQRSETPIFIEYEGKPLLLSVYSELIIFQEILKVLRETLGAPEQFLKNIYTITIWGTLSAISIRLLRLPIEANLHNFRLQTISTLYSLCQQAIEIYCNHNAKQEMSVKEQTQFIYVFMVQLAETEAYLKTKKQISLDSKPNENHKFFRKELRWGSAVHKEQSYLGASTSASLSRDTENIYSHTQETELLKGYTPESISLNPKLMQRLVNRKESMHFHSSGNRRPICGYAEHQYNRLVDLVKNTYQRLKPILPPENSEAGKVIANVFKQLTRYSNTSSEVYLNDFSIEGVEISQRSDLFGSDRKDRSKTNSIPAPQFRKSVKKALAWRFEQLKQKTKEQATEMLEKDQKEDFASLIKKMGFEKVSSLIQENKGRVKQLIRQQHEKYLMSKLETLVNQQVNVEQFLGLETSVDNLVFFNEQSSMDQKLILLLANRDFINSLSQEVQNQSEGLRRAFYEQKNKKKNRNRDDYSSEEDEEEDEDDVDEIEDSEVDDFVDDNNDFGLEGMARFAKNKKKADIILEEAGELNPKKEDIVEKDKEKEEKKEEDNEDDWGSDDGSEDESDEEEKKEKEGEKIKEKETKEKAQEEEDNEEDWGSDDESEEEPIVKSKGRKEKKSNAPDLKVPKDLETKEIDPEPKEEKKEEQAIKNEEDNEEDWGSDYESEEEPVVKSKGVKKEKKIHNPEVKAPQKEQESKETVEKPKEEKKEEQAAKNKEENEDDWGSDESEEGKAKQKKKIVSGVLKSKEIKAKKMGPGIDIDDDDEEWSSEEDGSEGGSDYDKSGNEEDGDEAKWPKKPKFKEEQNEEEKKEEVHEEEHKTLDQAKTRELQSVLRELMGNSQIHTVPIKKAKMAVKKSKRTREEGYISSSCHTDEGSDQEEIGDDEERDYSEENYDEESDEDMCEYGDYQHLYNKVGDTKEKNGHMGLYKQFMTRYRAVEKKMNEKGLLNVKENNEAVVNTDLQAYLAEWTKRYLFLFTHSQNTDQFEASAQTGLSMQSTYPLVIKFCILTLLDPTREMVTLPLLSLYVVGYDISYLQLWQSNPLNLKIKILTFMFEYALRSPSIFLKPFTTDNFSPFFDGNKDTKEVTFTIFDLLFRHYLTIFDKKDTDKTLQRILKELLGFLLQVRFVVKEDDVPGFVKELRQRNEMPLKDDTVQKFLSVIEEFTKNSDANSKKQTYQWLEHLTRAHIYTKDILLTCNRLLKAQTIQEKSILDAFIKRVNECLYGSEEPSFSEKAYFHNFLSSLQLQVPDTLRILSFIFNDTTAGHKISKFGQEIELMKTELKEISVTYMEALEAISKLKEKNCVESINTFKAKLKEMLEVPVQIHLYFTNLKEAASMSARLGVIDLTQQVVLKRAISDENSYPKLERSYSLMRKDSSNFEEGLMSWLKKCKEFVNDVLRGSNTGEKDSDLWVVKKFPWILDFNVKEKILMNFLQKNSEERLADEDDQEETTLFIRRENILEDTLTEFESYEQNGALHNFRIEFVKEPGVDQGGLKKEWLTLLSKEIFDPRRGLFKLSPNMRTIHPNPLSIVQPGQNDCFKVAGIIAALAIKERIPLDVNFSKSFLKLILGGQPNLNDLEDIDPEIMNSLTWMLNNDVEAIGLPFTYELEVLDQKIVQELTDNGANTDIDNENKELYISSICKAKTQKEVEKQVQSFKAGFSQIIPPGLLELFSAGEIEILISGKSEIDKQDLKTYALYKEISKENILVQWFWDIVEIMDQDMLANLLFFITGSSKVPHGGFKDYPITLTKGSSQISSLPIAHTCFSELEIPAYESKDQFYEKLVLAISEGKEGFYIA